MPQEKVLIVDDDENNRAVLCDALSSEPYELFEAADGHQALACADKEVPDLILLDVLMPGMDGIAVLRKLKANEKTRHIPVIVVTALNLDSQVSMCLEEGAIDHIAKPFSSLVVRARTRAAIRAHRRESVAEARPAKHGKILGFLGAKGGVGVTTVAVNVALSLAKRENSVVLAELRTYFGTAAPQLGVAASLNLGALLANSGQGDIDRHMLADCLTNHPSGLRLLLAPPGMEWTQELGPRQAESIVKTLAGMFEYVVLDFPSLPSPANEAALRCCDHVALVVEMEPTSVAAARAMLKALGAWGISGSSVGAVFVARARVTSSMTVAQVRAGLECRVIGVIPPDPELCILALKSNTPLILSQPNSIFTGAIVELTNRLAAKEVVALVF